MADNAITWLEPTTKCNIFCEGCYRENNPDGHKSLSKVIKELETVKRLRKTDGISIAGGEPLIYPDIVELVRHVSSQGWKPIINSNGQALTPELIRKLKHAGLVGFTFHVDSHQKRPGWIDKSEEELNTLRLKLAEMTKEAGGGRIACAFNATIYEDTLGEIPMLTQWAHNHMDMVQTMVYILFRSINRDEKDWDAFVHGEKIDPVKVVDKLVYQRDYDEGVHRNITAQEIADKIRETYSDYEPCAFLNGTEDSRSLKWLLSLVVGPNGKPLGYMDNKFAELLQLFHHFFFGTYLAYTRPWLMKCFQTFFPMAVFNKGMRKVLLNWLKNPSKWLSPLYGQAIMVIQPIDVFEDGRQNMCDGCPDILPYGERLVWSCRVDELEKFGGFVASIPKNK
jgi:organic radical activating enzyme